MKTPLSEVYKELDTITGLLSTQVRTVVLGVLAVVWLFLSHNKDAPNLSISNHQTQLAWIAGLCVLALLADLLQYQFGYFSARKTMLLAETSGAKGATEVSYNSKAFPYRARLWMFWVKQFIAIAAAVWLLGLLAAALS